jgi:hypothetical protein
MRQPRGYQRHPRFTKRLEATFSSGGLSYRGILSNLSQNGLFIRTNRGFAPGSTVDIELVMPDNALCRLKGIVKRTIKTPMSYGKRCGISEFCRIFRRRERNRDGNTASGISDHLLSGLRREKQGPE